MLVLSRKSGESITIGEDIVVTVVGVNGTQAKLGITAPRNVQVLREEVYQTMKEENRAAAGGLQHLSVIDEVLEHLHRTKREGQRG